MCSDPRYRRGGKVCVGMSVRDPVLEIKVTDPRLVVASRHSHVGRGRKAPRGPGRASTPGYIRIDKFFIPQGSILVACVSSTHRKGFHCGVMPWFWIGLDKGTWLVVSIGRDAHAITKS